MKNHANFERQFTSKDAGNIAPTRFAAKNQRRKTVLSFLKLPF
jgi:hypothetical protein